MMKPAINVLVSRARLQSIEELADFGAEAECCD